MGKISDTQTTIEIQPVRPTQAILATKAPLPSLPLALEGREERQGLDLRRWPRHVVIKNKP